VDDGYLSPVVFDSHFYSNLFLDGKYRTYRIIVIWCRIPAVLSNRFKFPFPIALVLSGLLISLIPGLPLISLQPYVVFIVFLPPLLYGAAWNISWHESKTYWRAISWLL